MRFGGRLSAAIEVLTDVEARHRPVSEALKDWGTAHRFAGSGDRAAIGNIVYDALRWRASSAWIAGDPSPRSVVLATVIRRWNVSSAELSQRLEGDDHAPERLSDEEAKRITEADLAVAPDHVRADVPEWTAPGFARVFGDRWVGEGEALALRPPLDMRANRIKANRDKVGKTLARFGVVDTPFSPDGLRIAPTEGDGRHPNVQVEPAFQKGWFEVQDEGSQIAALCVGAAPGKQILDLCAGAGGKTLALAAIMGGKGRVVATDSDRARLAPIFERAKRAAAHNIEVRAAGAPLNDLANRMDAVLVDAPCTGSGVWRRRPDAKWKLTERALGNRLGEQVALLADAGRYVKPGGRLVYVTCSVLPEENADQVTRFAAENPGFRLVPGTGVIAASGSETLAGSALLLPEGVVLSPARTGTDGFFIAVLERIS